MRYKQWLLPLISIILITRMFGEAIAYENYGQGTYNDVPRKYPSYGRQPGRSSSVEQYKGRVVDTAGIKRLMTNNTAEILHPKYPGMPMRIYFENEEIAYSLEPTRLVKMNWYARDNYLCTKKFKRGRTKRTCNRLVFKGDHLLALGKYGEPPLIVRVYEEDVFGLKKYWQANSPSAAAREKQKEDLMQELAARVIVFGALALLAFSDSDSSSNSSGSGANSAWNYEQNEREKAKKHSGKAEEENQNPSGRQPFWGNEKDGTAVY